MFCVSWEVSRRSNETDVVLNYAVMLKFENNIEDRARLWDTALKFLSPVNRVTSLGHQAHMNKS